MTADQNLSIMLFVPIIIIAAENAAVKVAGNER